MNDIKLGCIILRADITMISIDVPLFGQNMKHSINLTDGKSQFPALWTDFKKYIDKMRWVLFQYVWHVCYIGRYLVFMSVFVTDAGIIL